MFGRFEMFKHCLIWIRSLKKVATLTSCNYSVMSGSVDCVSLDLNAPLLAEMVKRLAPPLSYESHKGQAGRIGIVGGCAEYTGAPYFAAITALKVGCDLSHVFCTREASTVIKSYSPELIVHPILDSPSSTSEIVTWMERLHCMVIGPGLGRDPRILSAAKEIIHQTKSMNLPLIIDADGLHLINEDLDIIKSYTKTILTPNAVEFSRLYKVVTGNIPADDHLPEAVTEVCNALGNVTIVRKGASDIISNGHKVLQCRAEGSPRRCGGQGDVLSGSLGTFVHWAHIADRRPNKHSVLIDCGPTMCAAYAACLLTRECNRLAFYKLQRSTTTTDMIVQLPLAVIKVVN